MNYFFGKYNETFLRLIIFFQFIFNIKALFTYELELLFSLIDNNSISLYTYKTHNTSQKSNADSNQL